MRRREFLIAHALAAGLSRAEASSAGRRGLHCPGTAVPPAAADLAAAAVQFVSADRPASKTPLQLRASRGGVAGVRANEADCLRAVANGSGVVVSLAEADLESIGRVYRKLAALDSWTLDARPIVDIGLLDATGDSPYGGLLLDLHEQFDVIGERSDYSAYRLLLLPDVRKADPARLRLFQKHGGSILEPPREAFAEALRKFVPKPAVIAPGLPADAEVTYLEQRLPGGIRRVAHVLYFPGGEPGLLENVRLSVRLPQHPLGVVTVPDLRPVEFEHNEFLTTFALPRVLGHQAVAFE